MGILRTSALLVFVVIDIVFDVALLVCHIDTMRPTTDWFLFNFQREIGDERSR